MGYSELGLKIESNELRRPKKIIIKDEVTVFLLSGDSLILEDL